MDSSHDDAVYLCIRNNAVPEAHWPQAGLLSSLALEPSAGAWRAAARQLAGQGLIRAAGAAMWTAAEMTPLALDRADIFRDWAELDDAGGDDESAAIRRRVARRLGGDADPGRVLELEGGDGWVMVKANDPGAFAEMLRSLGPSPLDDDPLRGNGPALVAVDGSAFVGARHDFTFAVLDETGPLVLVACDVTGNGMMTRGEAAVQLTRLRPQVPDWAVGLAVEQLAHLTRWSGAGRLLVEDDQSQPLRQWMEPRSRHVSHLAYCVVDLSQPLDVIRRSYRETHRQQVAWGRKHLRVEKLADPTSLYDGFCELYRTGNRLTPQFTRHSLAQPGLHLFAAWLGADLASVVVTSDFGACCYYTAGARMAGSKQPLTHVLIDAAIEDAKARGQACFSFGALHLDGGAGEKLQGIAGFKRGFAARLTPVDWVTVKV